MSSESLKPGQKFPTPTPGNGDRVFYETLLHQRPDSDMALEWCVNYGVLPEEDAAKALKKVLKRKEREKAKKGSIGGGSAAASSDSAKKKKKKAKKVLDDAAYDAGMGAGGDEGIGIATL